MLARTTAVSIVLAFAAAAAPRAQASDASVGATAPLVVQLRSANRASAARVTIRDAGDGGVAVTLVPDETRPDAAGMSGQLSGEQAALYAQATAIQRDQQGVVRGLATFAPPPRPASSGAAGCGGPWSSRALHADGAGRLSGTLAGVTVAQLAAAHASIAVRRANGALYLVATCGDSTRSR